MYVKNNCSTKNKKYKHLTYSERVQIQRWFNKDMKTTKEIAILLNKSQRTIQREIKRGLVENRNYLWEVIYVYSADIAQNNYDYNIKAKGPELKIENDERLMKFIETTTLVLKWSPEAIVGFINDRNLKFNNPISSKTIRSYIKKDVFYNIKSDHYIFKKSNKKYGSRKIVSCKVPAEKSIEFRPESANLRNELGHWEGDLVVGKRSGKNAVLLTLVERLSRKIKVIKIKDKKSSSVIKAFNSLEKEYKFNFSNEFKSITFDNGSEFLDYKAIEKSIYKKINKRTIIYYAHPYCSFERGTNENGNRMIRRWIKKGEDINKYTHKEIKEIENWINNYPRKIFDYQSSNMIYSKKIK